MHMIDKKLCQFDNVNDIFAFQYCQRRPECLYLSLLEIKSWAIDQVMGHMARNQGQTHNGTSDVAYSDRLFQWLTLGLGTESLLRTGIAITAVTYALGYLTVTLHLSRFGVSAFEVLRLQYAMAGFWFLYPLLAAILAPTIISLAANMLSIKDIFSSRALSFGYLGALLVVVLVALGLPMIILIKVAGMSQAAIPFVGVPALLLILTSQFFLIERRKVPRPPTRLRFQRLLVCLAVLYLALQLPTYVLTGYAWIPRELGGGRPVPIKAMLDSQRPIGALQDRTVIADSALVKCRLLYESNDQVFLLPYDSANTVISISKEHILSIVYNP